MIRRLLTYNFTRVPILWIDFNYQLYKKKEKGSCMLRIHPSLENDQLILDTMNELVDYIRKNYNMKGLL
jgi:hypothetical protein